MPSRGAGLSGMRGMASPIGVPTGLRRPARALRLWVFIPGVGGWLAVARALVRHWFTNSSYPLRKNNSNTLLNEVQSVLTTSNIKQYRTRGNPEGLRKVINRLNNLANYQKED